MLVSSATPVQREAVKEALGAGSRPAELPQRRLCEGVVTSLGEGQKSVARKEGL